LCLVSVPESARLLPRWRRYAYDSAVGLKNAAGESWDQAMDAAYRNWEKTGKGRQQTWDEVGDPLPDWQGWLTDSHSIIGLQLSASVLGFGTLINCWLLAKCEGGCPWHRV
jgi:hypothetical protein